MNPIHPHCGPFNAVSNKRSDSKTDEACRQHDIAYGKYQGGSKWHQRKYWEPYYMYSKADDVLLRDFERSEPSVVKSLYKSYFNVKKKFAPVMRKPSSASNNLRRVRMAADPSEFAHRQSQRGRYRQPYAEEVKTYDDNAIAAAAAVPLPNDPWVTPQRLARDAAFARNAFARQFILQNNMYGRRRSYRQRNPRRPSRSRSMRKIKKKVSFKKKGRKRSRKATKYELKKSAFDKKWEIAIVAGGIPSTWIRTRHYNMTGVTNKSTFFIPGYDIGSANANPFNMVGTRHIDCVNAILNDMGLSDDIDYSTKYLVGSVMLKSFKCKHQFSNTGNETINVTIYKCTHTRDIVGSVPALGASDDALALGIMAYNQKNTNKFVTAGTDPLYVYDGATRKGSFDDNYYNGFKLLKQGLKDYCKVKQLYKFKLAPNENKTLTRYIDSKIYHTNDLWVGSLETGVGSSHNKLIRKGLSYWIVQISSPMNLLSSAATVAGIKLTGQAGGQLSMVSRYMGKGCYNFNSHALTAPLPKLYNWVEQAGADPYKETTYTNLRIINDALAEAAAL